MRPRSPEIAQSRVSKRQAEAQLSESVLAGELMPLDVEIVAKPESLRRLGASGREFDAALDAALERLAGVPLRKLPAPQNIPLVLLGREHALGELARIRFRFDG